MLAKNFLDRGELKVASKVDCDMAYKLAVDVANEKEVTVLITACSTQFSYVARILSKHGVKDGEKILVAKLRNLYQLRDVITENGVSLVILDSLVVFNPDKESRIFILLQLAKMAKELNVAIYVNCKEDW